LRDDRETRLTGSIFSEAPGRADEGGEGGAAKTSFNNKKKHMNGASQTVELEAPKRLGDFIFRGRRLVEDKGRGGGNILKEESAAIAGDPGGVNHSGRVLS